MCIPEVEGPLYISVSLLLSLSTLLLRRNTPLLLTAPSLLTGWVPGCSRMGQRHLGGALYTRHTARSGPKSKAPASHLVRPARGARTL